MLYFSVIIDDFETRSRRFNDQLSGELVYTEYVFIDITLNIEELNKRKLLVITKYTVIRAFIAAISRNYLFLFFKHFFLYFIHPLWLSHSL